MKVETQNDLCGDMVTLDYQTMLEVANVAIHYAKEAISVGLNTLYQFPSTESESMKKIVASNLADNARALNIAMNMATTLTVGLDRSEVNIVNHRPKNHHHKNDDSVKKPAND